jgi:putative ABC transport system ATP-binding protein
VKADVTQPLVSVEDVSVRYGLGRREVLALRNVSLSVSAGEFVSVTGPSGSGKTTLLNVIAGLEHPASGEVKVEGRRLTEFSDAELATLRRSTLSYVFQFFGLLPALTAEQNVAIPLRAHGMSRDEVVQRVRRALVSVGMEARRTHYPEELSGGEMQRVAIARALATDARLILADEPTGNLDTLRGEEVLDLLRSVVDDQGRSVLLVTHDVRAGAYGDRLITMRDGQLVDEVRGDRGRAVVSRL